MITKQTRTQKQRITIIICAALVALLLPVYFLFVRPLLQEEPVEGYVATYLNNGRTIVNSIPVEDLPPTPTPTLPYITPTPSPTIRIPAGVQFINGEWVYVDEYGVPLGGVPQTGDDTNFAPWGCAVVLPLLIAVLAAVEIRRRKRWMAMEGKKE
jgi:hypothetical protein